MKQSIYTELNGKPLIYKISNLYKQYGSLREKKINSVVYAAWKKGAEGGELDRCEVGWVTSLTP